MTNYYNNTTQEERKRLIAEASLPTSYSKLAGLDDDLGGRYREKQTVAGEEKATDYPRQDSASPWSGGGADPGVEAPLGVAIDEMEPTGEQFEVDRSIADLGGPEPGAIHASRVPNQELKSALEGSGSSPSLAEAQAPLEVVTPALSVETALAIPSMMKRRKLV
jgi:hypothetical protein